MRVIISPAAGEDLKSIFEYIAGENAQRAVTTVDRLESACLALGEEASWFPLLPHHEMTGIRRRVVYPYNVYYRIVDGTVFVIHVIHGARDQNRALFGED